ncbi:FdxN element excision controlling factor protein [Candidatus Thiomargarita nelsonii]|uniref:FdxN element excision controlling factor protein n=1 Tax=Candidatus Thiomargarita nelsonii TaxID=1003181 RepID=A0A4E0RF52_9GAMM|nr:FdxN element excision controlling factor protein [Candidatus Thiomargarita nelsonii]
MDTLENYCQIIQKVLAQYTKISYANVDVQNEAIFDQTNDRYCVISGGWDEVRRIHGCLIHIDVINGKVWIQRDDTEDGIAYELENAGIPKSSIVLGFKNPDVRQYTEYAVA